MGGGKSSSSSQVQMTPEQQRVLGIQANALENTFMPAYQRTIGKAEDALSQTSPAAITAANTAMGVSGRAGALQEATGTAGLLTGMGGLASLFDPQYEQEQVDAALQAGRESGREEMNQQVASYGGAGGLGSSRAALASQNLAGLQAQRQATAAAGARAGVQANKAAAARELMAGGQGQLTAAQQAAAGRVSLAQTPQDILAKYASVVYGTPQASTTPNFQGTQGSTGSSKGFGVQAPKWG
jgi:hypothetical protein